MRRIVHLESQEEPSLPDLPSFSNNTLGDLTFPDSPDFKQQQQQQQQSSSLQSQSNNSTPFNFTSTPLPSSSTYSKSFHSANSNQSNQTILGDNNKNSNFNQHFSSSYKTLVEEEDEEEEELNRREFDLPSFEDVENGQDSIDKVQEEEREDMIVLSGSGGEDSTGGVDGRRFQVSKPLSSRDFIVPIAPASPTSSVEGDARDAQPRRISANVSIRRKSSFKSTPSTRFISDENSTPSSADSPSSQSHSTIVPLHSKLDISSALELPSTFSPLRELSNNSNHNNSTSTSLESPGIGRHASPHLSPNQSNNTMLSHQQSTYEPKTPSPYTDSKSYATPVPSLLSRTDAERRKEHLLATLRSTMKPTLTSTSRPKMAKGTPHPHRNPLKRGNLTTPLSAGTNIDRDDDSIMSDTTSSQDLTTHRRANTSLPSGALRNDNELDNPSTNRFGGAKVNVILQSFNAQLIEENTSLAQMLGTASAEVGRLREEKRDWELSMVGGNSTNGGGGSTSGRDETENNTLVMNKVKELEAREKEVELKEMELEGLVKSHGGILELKQELVQSLGNNVEEGTKITELERNKEKMERTLAEKEKEILELREKLVVVQVQSASPQSSPHNSNDPQSNQEDSITSPSALIEELQREIFELKDQLSESNSKSEELVQLQEEFTQATEKHIRETANLNHRADDLLVELEERDSELENLRNELTEQERDFGEKMQGLEEELCKVMEEQESQLEQARIDLEETRVQDQKTREEEKLVLEEMRKNLREVEEERDSLVQRLDRSGSTSELGGESLQQWKEKVQELESIIQSKDEELSKLNSEMDEFESKVDAIDLSRNLSRQEAEERITSQAEEIKQMEEALDESTQQMIQYEEEIDSLKSTLEKERKVLAALTNQSSQAYKTKSKSPLANEILSNTRDLTIATLEEELELVKNEVSTLKEELRSKTEKSSSNGRDSATSASNVKDQQRIKNLEVNKVELEATVSNLRKQVLNHATTNSNSTPTKYQDSSFFLKSLRGVDTPRFFDQSLYSPGTEADATMGPLHAEIHRLELMVTELQSQLLTTNVSIVTRQLEEARARILVLEGLLKRQGSSSSDESDSGTPRVTEALRAALAGVNAKLSELKSENSVLQNASSRARELSRKHKALQDDFAVARSEITSLEGSLRTTRASLSTLSEEHTRSKQTLSIQLERHLSEIRSLRESLASGVSRERVLQDERGDILRGVEGLQSDLNRVRRDAISLGLDLAKEVERRKFAGGEELERLQMELEATKRRLREHTCSADSNSLVELKTRHSQESKGLLLMIRYLKSRITREASFRIDTAYQKEYLNRILKEQKTLIDVTKATLIDLGCAPRLTSSDTRRSRPSFKAAALAAIAISRMNAMSKAWKATSSIKTKLREQAYPETRGRPFPRSST